jgi:D-alanyl-D-alanine carboxypeptidase/D-alanyl-D-alanine-endopeptidase (penicillin-binding protein 4)
VGLPAASRSAPPVSRFALAIASLGRLLAVVCSLALLGAAAFAAPPAHAAGVAATKRALAHAWAGAGMAGAYALDLDTNRVLLASAPSKRRIPASVNKLFTTATALTRFGAGGTLRTDVLAQAAPDATGVVRGDLYLRGGGDPTFGTSQARSLARQLATNGLTRVTGRVVGDESAWDTLRGGPESNWGVSDWAGPLSALAYDEGMNGGSDQAQPARFAARAFTHLLRGAGVRVGRSGEAGVTAPGATPLLSWVSPDMGAIVARTLIPSDNYLAEELLKGIGARFGLAGSTAAGTTVVKATVEDFRAHPRLVDGSGLSRRDRTSPREVVRLLAALDRSSLADVFENALPLAGRTGTLADRMRSTAAGGRCRAKTGTLSDVSALAGICESTHGRRVAFALLMNRTSVYWAHVRQDRIATILARYG